MIVRNALLLAVLIAQPCFGKIWAYNAMTIRADDASLRKKVKSGKICFAVDSAEILTKNFPGLKWSMEKNRLIGHANQKSKHMFTLFSEKQKCIRSARIAAESGVLEHQAPLRLQNTTRTCACPFI